MVRFKFLTGDVNWQKYGGKFVSQKLNNGDWDYYLVLDVINMHEATGDEDQPKYNVTIEAVSPEAVKLHNIENYNTAMRADLPEGLEITELIEVECISEYGIYAPLWTKNGDNLAKLMREARHEAQVCSALFGFYMDGPKNRIGQTGWDCIVGQDIREFLGM